MNKFKIILIYLTSMLLVLVTGCSDKKLDVDNFIISQLNSSYEYVKNSKTIYDNFCNGEISREEALDDLSDIKSNFDSIQNEIKSLADNNIDDPSTVSNWTPLSKYISDMNTYIIEMYLLYDHYYTVIDSAPFSLESNMEFISEMESIFLHNLNKSIKEDTSRKEYLQSLGYSKNEVDEIISYNNFIIDKQWN